MLLLALLGARQVMRSWMMGSGDFGQWAEKNERFREKIRAAFRVWQEPAAESGPDEPS